MSAISWPGGHFQRKPTMPNREAAVTHRIRMIWRRDAV
jgi:hypothetical protein